MAEEWIAAGRVTIDGAPARLGQKADPATTRIEVDGVPLPLNPDLVYVLAYKPVGTVSTASDPQGRPTVVEMAGEEARVFPVGRLDADSEGLILLTNDGELTERLTHPRYGVPKTYVTEVTGVVTAPGLRRLTAGVDLDDGPALALSARIVGSTPERSLVEVVMGEGRNREVRRMLDAIGHPVLRLVRTAIGPLRDGALKSGSTRRLTPHEVRALYEASGH